MLFKELKVGEQFLSDGLYGAWQKIGNKSKLYCLDCKEKEEFANSLDVNIAKWFCPNCSNVLPIKYFGDLRKEELIILFKQLTQFHGIEMEFSPYGYYVEFVIRSLSSYNKLLETIMNIEDYSLFFPIMERIVHDQSGIIQSVQNIYPKIKEYDIKYKNVTIEIEWDLPQT